MFDYDAELVGYHRRLREAADVQPADRVLDIGCGTGQTTRVAAGSAWSGAALGVDVSRAMLDRARELSRSEEVDNVGFVQADAQSLPLAPAQFTLGLSRFGTMFFTDPVAAFADIGRALRPGARLVQLVWQAQEHQEWSTAIREALIGRATMDPAVGGGAFSLADPTVARGVLTAGGFSDVELTTILEPVYYGADAAAALDAVVELQMVDHLTADLDSAGRSRALDRLQTMLDAHDAGDGVWFDSQAWLITARRP